MMYNIILLFSSEMPNLVKNVLEFSPKIESIKRLIPKAAFKRRDTNKNPKNKRNLNFTFLSIHVFNQKQ